MAAGAGADASRQREICDALLLAAQDLEQGRAQARRHAGGNQPPGRRRRRGAPPSPCRPSWWPATRPAWTRGPARWPRWPQRCARNGSRPAPMPPAASSRSARRWPTPPARSRINRAPTPATRWPRSTAWSMPPPRRRPPSPCKATWWPATARLMPGPDRWPTWPPLREEWQQTGAATASRQQEICDALAQAARHLRAHPPTPAPPSPRSSAWRSRVRSAARRRRGHRRTASEAVRQPGHDNAMLEERGRLLDTLATLLDAVNLASTEQRAAVARWSAPPRN